MSKKAQAEANIQTFLRIRPSKVPSGYFTEEGGSLKFNLPEFKSSNLRAAERDYFISLFMDLLNTEPLAYSILWLASCIYCMKLFFPF